MLNAIETRAPPAIDDLAGLPDEVSRVAVGFATEVAETDKVFTALDEQSTYDLAARAGGAAATKRGSEDAR